MAEMERHTKLLLASQRSVVSREWRVALKRTRIGEKYFSKTNTVIEFDLQFSLIVLKLVNYTFLGSHLDASLAFSLD